MIRGSCVCHRCCNNMLVIKNGNCQDIYFSFPFEEREVNDAWFLCLIHLNSIRVAQTAGKDSLLPKPEHSLYSNGTHWKQFPLDEMVRIEPRRRLCFIHLDFIHTKFVWNTFAMPITIYYLYAYCFRENLFFSFLFCKSRFRWVSDANAVNENWIEAIVRNCMVMWKYHQ